MIINKLKKYIFLLFGGICLLGFFAFYHMKERDDLSKIICSMEIPFNGFLFFDIEGIGNNSDFNAYISAPSSATQRHGEAEDNDCVTPPEGELCEGDQKGAAAALYSAHKVAFPVSIDIEFSNKKNVVTVKIENTTEHSIKVVPPYFAPASNLYFYSFDSLGNEISLAPPGSSVSPPYESLQAHETRIYTMDIGGFIRNDIVYKSLNFEYSADVVDHCGKAMKEQICGSVKGVPKKD